MAGPGYLGYDGGVYNPGAIIHNSIGLILLAKGQTCHWYDAVGSKADLYCKGAPIFFKLNQSLNITSSYGIKSIKQFPNLDRVGFEDFRLFKYKEEIWVNHSMIPLVKKNDCVWTFRSAIPCLSHLEEDLNTLTFLGHPQLDIPLNSIEKNWVYLEDNFELYLFYSFSPYRVLKLVDRRNLRFSTVVNCPLKGKLTDIGGVGTMISYSTNPIEYDEQYWLLLVHQIKQSRIERIYYHWGVLVDKKTLLPHKITEKFLFSGLGARGRKPGIVYVSSVIKQDENFIFFMGEGDTYITRASLTKQALDQMWCNV